MGADMSKTSLTPKEQASCERKGREDILRALGYEDEGNGIFRPATKAAPATAAITIPTLPSALTTATATPTLSPNLTWTPSISGSSNSAPKQFATLVRSTAATSRPAMISQPHSTVTTEETSFGVLVPSGMSLDGQSSGEVVSAIGGGARGNKTQTWRPENTKEREKVDIGTADLAVRDECRTQKPLSDNQSAPDSASMPMPEPPASHEHEFRGKRSSDGFQRIIHDATKCKSNDAYHSQIAGKWWSDIASKGEPQGVFLHTRVGE
ncbi:unnamed protein product [Zymoseptoria tritici ST99CH_1E4]|nr:unnamed protein product [Zymoseptoria tritici ST99CH_1E4]